MYVQGEVILKYSNYLSNEFNRELYNIIDVDSVGDEVMKLIDKELDGFIESFCEGCDKAREYRERHG